MDTLKTTIDAGATGTPTARLLRAADACRAMDLERLVILAELVKDVSELVHSLQRERGVSSIFLGSNGARFADRRTAQADESRELERPVRERLERIDAKLERMSPGAGFYLRIAFALRALDILAGIREQIAALAPAPQDAVKAFTDIIGALLAVGFEAANIAADPVTSRVLIALVSFAQGKEYAGQERATAGAALSRGRLESADRRRLKRLQAAQERALQIFADFAGARHADRYRESMSRDCRAAELARMRQEILQWSADDEPPSITADAWYELTTRRIDEMRLIEERLAADLQRLCADTLAEARTRAKYGGAAACGALQPSAPVAMLVAEVASATAAGDPGIEDGIGMYSLEHALPRTMRSILDVIDAQSRHIEQINRQLETARLALAERKTIERAKGLLMRSRRLSESDAYELMRQTAMKQNKRVYQVAEAILSMADLLR